MKNQNESGRSMVEMLGVLAIIGVLSVMGISGYIAAMQKHKTNTVIHEAAKRAVTISGQLSTSLGSVPSLSGFETETEYANFPSVEKVEGQEQFKLTINNMSESLCQSVKATAEDDIFVQQVDASCASGSVILYYNNDLGNGIALAEEEQGPNCEDGQEVVDGTCMARCPEGVTRASNKSCSVCANGNVYLSYESNPCQRSVSGCKSNSDCGDNEYCQLTGSSCNYPTSGTCKSIGGSSGAFVDGLGDLIRSSAYMNWWSADNWCKAQGKSLIDVADLNCYRNGSKITENSAVYDFVSCDMLTAIKSKLGGFVMWNLSNWQSGTTCYASVINLHNFHVDYGWRNGSDASDRNALCY